MSVVRPEEDGDTGMFARLDVLCDLIDDDVDTAVVCRICSLFVRPYRVRAECISTFFLPSVAFLFMIGTSDELDAEGIAVGSGVSESGREMFRVALEVGLEGAEDKGGFSSGAGGVAFVDFVEFLGEHECVPVEGGLVP